MRNCPFCGKKVHFGLPQLLRLSNGQWSFMHHCSQKASIMITANTKKEILQIWEGNHVEEHSSEQ